jgi:hypothetical protein
MKIFILIGILLLANISCNPTKLLNSKDVINVGPEISDEMNKFLLAFEYHVKNNSRKKLVDFIDQNYKSEQLNNLEGDLIQFIDELFCGYETFSSEFKCVTLKEIVEIRLIEMVEESQNLYSAIYIISVKDFKIKVNWSIRRAENNLNSGFGFIGAYG